MKISTINRFFNILLGALAMVAVAIFSAYIAMRVAIHGREVEVPELTSLSLPEAQKKAAALGIRLNVESRFYSATLPPGTVIGQSPAPGITVRRQYAVRITESLGAQQVAIPNLTGQTERPATITLRRLALELGTTAYLPAAGPAGVVLAQTPLASEISTASPSGTAGTSGIDSPRVSLLLSGLPSGAPDPNSEADALAPASAFVMPTLTGLTLSAAAARAAAAGLHILSAEEIGAPPAASAPISTSAAAALTPAPQPAGPAPAPNTSTTGSVIAPGTVVAQTPPAGHRILQGEPVRLVLSQ